LNPSARQVPDTEAYALLSMPAEDGISVSGLVAFDVSRPRIHLPAALAGLFFTGVSPVSAANEVVAGDSLGVGISMAAKLENVSANSVTIRGNRAIEQLRKIRPGSTVYLSLGTNDAVGPVKGIEKSIDAVVQTAKASRLKLIWLGPPCVNKAWDKNAIELDGILRSRLAGTGVTYVSMRDANLCTPSVRSKDGVHFNMEGYRNMWSKAAFASGYHVASVTTAYAEPPARVEMPAATTRQAAPPAEVTSQERPRVRTVVTPVSLVPVAAPAPTRQVTASASFFTLEFRWPETTRFTGSFVPSN
jgi:lysophospholipase L1-like esterase